MTNFFNACIGTVIAMVVSFVVCFVLYSVWAKQGKLDPSETEATNAFPLFPIAAGGRPLAGVCLLLFIPKSKDPDRSPKAAVRVRLGEVGCQFFSIRRRISRSVSFMPSRAIYPTSSMVFSTLSVTMPSPCSK